MRRFTLSLMVGAVLASTAGCGSDSSATVGARPISEPTLAAEVAASPTPTPTPSPSPAAVAGLTLTSADFDDGDYLEPWASGNAFGGQCEGDNLNPELSWSEVPEGTVELALTMVDESAANYVHWVHVGIDPSVTHVPRGGSGELAGAMGQSGIGELGYFGPCPPGADHRYVFTVWALDTALELEEGARHATFFLASRDHVIESASLTGIYHTP